MVLNQPERVLLTTLNFPTAPNLRQKLRVRMINAQGLEEAGVDGGGVFRYVGGLSHSSLV